MPYLDFGAIKAAVKIERALEHLGLQMRGNGPQLRGPCPACKSGGDRALAVNTDKQSFYCWAARAGGDVIGLTAHVLGLSAKDAAQRLSGTFLIKEHSSPERPSLEGASQRAPSPGLEPLSYLEFEHPAVDAVGIDAETAAALGIGFAGRGTMNGLVCVPVRLEDGTLVGYLGVTEIARLPKSWKFPEQKVVPLKRSGAA